MSLGQQVAAVRRGHGRRVGAGAGPAAAHRGGRGERRGYVPLLKII